MKKVTEFISIHDMDEPSKEKFLDIIYDNYQSDIRKFINDNKTYIKSRLTGGNKTNFDDVIKKNNLKVNFLGKILESIDKEKYDKLINKFLKTIFKEDKELSDSITSKKEYDENKIVQYIAMHHGKGDEELNFFRCIGGGFDITEEMVKSQNKKINDLKLSEIKKELDSLKEKYDSLKEDNKDYKRLQNEHDKLKDDYNALKKAKGEIETQKNNLENDVKTLKSNLKTSEDDVTKLKNENEELRQKLLSKDATDKKEIVEDIIQTEQDDNADYESEKPLVKLNQLIISDIESRTMLGMVRPENIRIERNYLLITPLVPIISDNSNIDIQDFEDKVQYRGDYSTFILFLNPSVLNILFDEDQKNVFYSSPRDQKYDLIFRRLNNKLIFFRPSFYFDEEIGKYKLNAELVSEPTELRNYKNSTFIPFTDESKKKFEKRLTEKTDIVLPNYPYTLSKSLKYVYAGDSIYEINYIPRGQSADGRYISWKYNCDVDNNPFRKIDLNMTSNFSDAYIKVPGIGKEVDGIYVKNIMLMHKTSDKSVVFDEESFINNVSKNAKSRNLYYEDKDLRNFHVALKSSNLVILAGPSGIGKTRLPIVYSNTLGLDTAKNSLLFVPISPSYLEPEDVLGYIRPISNKEESDFNAEYMESQTGLVSFLIDAADHPDKIHMVVFDEMNLSQIEHWFAPFISLLEQDPDSRVLKLYSEKLNVKNSDRYPSSILIGENVLFIGTVNIDETTKKISDRLLDRAIVINLTAPSFTNLKEMGTADLEIYPEITFSQFATSMAKVGNSTTAFDERELSLLNDLNALLGESIYDKAISFRSLNKMAIYLKNSKDILSRDVAFDFVISQIVAKRIDGSREELEEVLSDDDTQGILRLLNDYSDVSDFAHTRKIIQQKIKEINKYGFTR